MFGKNLRSFGATVTFGSVNPLAIAGGPSYDEFDKQNCVEVDGILLGPVSMPNGVEMVWPSGAITAHGNLHAPHREPIPRAEWQLRHAEVWAKLKAQEFAEAKRRAQMDCMNPDWIPHLKELARVATVAKANLKKRQIALEEAIDPAGVQRARNKQIAESLERDRQRQEQRRLAALAAINEIELSGDDTNEETE